MKNDAIQFHDEMDLVKQSFSKAIKFSSVNIDLFREKFAIPGISCAVEIGGKRIWTISYGYSDVLAEKPFDENSRIQVGSISKPITMALIARLWQNNILDIDRAVSDYVLNFTPKVVQGRSYCPTLRQLASHLGGIRHYWPVEYQRKVDATRLPGLYVDDYSNCSEYSNPPLYSDVLDSLHIFKNDDFVYLPGERFLYSTYGYSLLGAAAENAAGLPIPVLYGQMFHNHLALFRTDIDGFIDGKDCSKQYKRKLSGQMETTYSSCSSKIPGAGIVSSAGDLALFGSSMLHCLSRKSLNTYLSPEIMHEIWTPHSDSRCWHDGGKYALGWCILGPRFASPLLNKPVYVHLGQAIGATSILLLVPGSGFGVEEGLSLAISTNLDNVRGLGSLAIDIALKFYLLHCV